MYQNSRKEFKVGVETVLNANNIIRNYGQRTDPMQK